MLFSADVFLLMLMSSLYFVIFLVKSSTELSLRGPFTDFGMIAFMLNCSVNMLTCFFPSKMSLNRS